jgi:hypothetical protein
MKNLIFILFLIFCTTQYCSAQRIELQKTAFGFKCYQNDKKLNKTELNNLLKSNYQAPPLMQSARNTKGLALFIGFIGGIIIGQPLWNKARRNETNWNYIGLGAGMVIISIPIAINANKKAKKAVGLYNSSLTFLEKPNHNSIICLNNNGVGFKISF